MEKLTLREGKFNPKKSIGLVWLLGCFIPFIIWKHPLTEGAWMTAIVFAVIGIMHFTPIVGSGKYEIEAADGFLTITWYNWIRKVTIPETEIDGIVLGSKGILIKRREKKDVRIELYGLEREEKTLVYDFFSDYAKSRNLV
ncbi:MAG TPA: hypothetical protein VMT63_11160 [Bacteroidales bacterium]|nr:hypothetical protein [Bacteroidales bacterium]